MKILQNNKKLYFFFSACFLFSIFCIFSLCSCAPSNFEPQTKTPTINSPDILQSGVLKVGIEFGNPPLAGDSIKSSGVDLDVAAAIADELGLKVEFVDCGVSGEMAVEDKKVDIVMGITKISSTSDLWKSEPYIKTASALFSLSNNKNIPTKDSSDLISSQMASPSALAAQAQFNTQNIKIENSIETCFDALKNGNVKYVAADAVIGSYLVKNSGIDASICVLLSKPSGYCIGLNSENEALKNAISAALDTITKGGITEVIEKRWEGRSLDLDNLPQTPEAANQADAGELEDGVYSQIDPNAPRDNTNI